VSIRGQKVSSHISRFHTTYSIRSVACKMSHPLAAARIPKPKRVAIRTNHARYSGYQLSNAVINYHPPAQASLAKNHGRTRQSRQPRPLGIQRAGGARNDCKRFRSAKPSRFEFSLTAEIRRFTRKIEEIIKAERVYLEVVARHGGDPDASACYLSGTRLNTSSVAHLRLQVLNLLTLSESPTSPAPALFPPG
jgi:hypothetical protein